MRILILDLMRYIWQKNIIPLMIIFTHGNHICKKNKKTTLIPREKWLFLENIKDDERALALASLIKSAQMRCVLAVYYLSHYYRHGIYVSKDVDYADQLYEAYNK